MLMYMVKTQAWPVDRLRALLDHVHNETGLPQAQIAALVPMTQSQFSRWKSGSSRPKYESLLTLGESLRKRFPDIGVGPDELLTAAGYTTKPEDLAPPDAIEAKATATETTDTTHDVSAMEEEIARIVADMTPTERAQYERAVREEEEDYAHRLRRHRLIYAKLMRGEKPDDSVLNS
jgi:transcriptional regulator with XRE-family HTH domain